MVRSHINTYQGRGTFQGKIILIKRHFASLIFEIFGTPTDWQITDIVTIVYFSESDSKDSNLTDMIYYFKIELAAH